MRDIHIALPLRWIVARPSVDSLLTLAIGIVT
jgi:hypothetical protein